MDYLKERQKLNVSTLLTTQEIVDMAPIWQAVKGSVATWFFTANPAALDDSVLPYYMDAGLSKTHAQLLTVSTPKPGLSVCHGAA